MVVEIHSDVLFSAHTITYQNLFVKSVNCFMVDLYKLFVSQLAGFGTFWAGSAGPDCPAACEPEAGECPDHDYRREP